MNHKLISDLVGFRTVRFSSRRTLEHLAALASRTPVSKVMTHDVTCVRPDMDLLEEARDLLLEAAVWVAPVVDEALRPLGMVSLSDLLRDPSDFEDGGIPLCAFTGEGYHYPVGHGFHLATLPRLLVAHVMMPLVKTLSTHTTIAEAAEHFSYGKVGSLVVTDADGKLSGMVTRGDLNRWSASLDSDQTRLAKRDGAARWVG